MTIKITTKLKDGEQFTVNTHCSHCKQDAEYSGMYQQEGHFIEYKCTLCGYELVHDLNTDTLE